MRKTIRDKIRNTVIRKVLKIYEIKRNKKVDCNGMDTLCACLRIGPKRMLQMKPRGKRPRGIPRIIIIFPLTG